MQEHDISHGAAVTPPIQSLQSFCDAGGFSAITAWRMRKKGWLQTLNINGRQYVTAEQVAAFTRRAAAGEFAKAHVVPRREAVAA